ncbi:CubicO group peptidase (beta-lactamase class C family) [Aquimarina sp. MAR_2010_214]|uniref:serine hydrolase domain-containing protein n=1 Tax=Aquimarina sp. MAR_2010_214 TaxID=1250026 RepID=UPI000C712AFC|nr:serine hydrolase domain-containing protein [Aquimarina sp. MAR_2010_214]PKV51367.1 CubicO group peptidase (beta-lactamase class C family) [Aquimarina sp. MAR_2010_214]
MFNQQKTKFRHLTSTTLLALLISISSNAAWPIIAIDTIIEESGKPTDSLMNQSKCIQVQNKDVIRSFNDHIISKSEMDAFIKQQMDSLNMPGLSIAFINNDKIVYHNALGVKNNETQEKVDNATVFDAASMSKTVFSFFTMKMVDDGLLALDTPLYTYMEYPDIAYDERYKLITARMVLSHTSGFPNWRFLDQKGNYNPDGKLTIQFEPGTKFQYSGEGYEYLAKVISHLKGVEKNGLQGLINTAIFEPLAIKNTSFVWNDYIENHRADGHLKGKPNKGYSSSAKDPNFKASASLQTEAKAFANFLMAIMNNKILSEKSHQELLKIQSSSLATKKSKERKYGLGIVIEESDYGTNYFHGGDNLSNTAFYMFNKEKKVGYVFFTNSEHNDSFNKNLLKLMMYK